MKKIDYNDETHALNGNFSMNYLPMDRKYDTQEAIPFRMNLKIGKTFLGVNGTNYIFGGHLFHPLILLDGLKELENNQEYILNINEQFPVPVTFEPLNNGYLVGLDKCNVTKYASFPIYNLKKQLVDKKNIQQQITKSLNDFLNDLESNGKLGILDNIEESLSEFKNYSELYSSGEKAFKFDIDESTKRTTSSIVRNASIFRDYKTFIDFLSQRELKEWGCTLNSFKDLKNELTDTEIYSEFRSGILSSQSS